MLRLAAALLLAAGPGASVELTFSDPAIAESSGLVVDDATGSRLVVTTNDSGDSGRVFTVDPATGNTVGVTTWRDDPVDVEALAPAGPGEVWVADIGDNEAVRESVSVARVPVGPGDVTVSPTVEHELVYPDGARDAETLLVDPDGRFLVVTKGLLGGQFLRTEQPPGPGANPMAVVGVALPVATDGAFFPDGRHVVVRSYGSAVVYAYPSLDEVGSFALPDQEQGEGIAVDADGSVLLSSEGVGSEVLRLRLPRDVRRAMAPPEPEPGPAPERADEEQAEEGAAGAPVAQEGAAPPWWTWAIGALAGLAGVLLLVRVARGVRRR